MLSLVSKDSMLFREKHCMPFKETKACIDRRVELNMTKIKKNHHLIERELLNMRPQMLILIEKDFNEIIQWLLTSVFNFNLP